MLRFQLLVVALLAALGPSAAADMVINGYSHATNDRFTNSASFIAGAFNLSGVGQTDGGTSGSAGRWATAISRNVIISANHYRPPLNGSIYFYPGNDAGATPVTRQVVSGMRIGSTDLYVGLLDNPLPNSITHFDFSSEALMGTPPDSMGNISIENAGSLQDVNAWLLGKSPFNHNSDPNDNRTSYNDQAVGRNRITGYSENVPFGSNLNNDSLIMWHDPVGGIDFVPYEAEFRGGDSGGPLFVEVNGQLLLVGVNSFLLEDDFGNLIASGATYVGNQASLIRAFINANAVPEPGSGLLLIGAAGMISIGRRRRPEGQVARS
jgi:hypothetical protein